jgi:uncharacterized protein YbjT (DUF2867 family)
LDGQAVIVTGASSGLGVIVARALAAQGSAVILAARRQIGERGGWMILQSSILGRRAGTGFGVAVYAPQKAPSNN